MFELDDNAPGPHAVQPVFTAGKPLAEASGAMILVHGRGATAPNILELGRELYHPNLAYLAPQAADNTWYPYSFLAPISQNEPGISSGLAKIEALVAQVEAVGITAERIIIGGFSQGACLASEFVARHPVHYGGVLIFSGGLIGPLGLARNYPGSLNGTPIFMGCSDRDPHIPLERVDETAEVFTALAANVDKQIYPNMGHTIIADEIKRAKQIVDGLFQA